EIERHFGGQAAASLDTYSGHVKQLANDWDSVKESIGAAIANDDLVRASLRGVATAFSGASENAGGFSLAQLEVNTAILAGHPVLAKLIALLYDDAAAANKATEATRLLRDAKRQSADADVSGKSTSLPAGYIAELKAAKDALAALTSEQKKQIDAGLALHHSADDIAKDLNDQYTGLKLTAQAVTLY